MGEKAEDAQGLLPWSSQRGEGEGGWGRGGTGRCLGYLRRSQRHLTMGGRRYARKGRDHRKAHARQAPRNQHPLLPARGRLDAGHLRAITFTHLKRKGRGHPAGRFRREGCGEPARAAATGPRGNADLGLGAAVSGFGYAGSIPGRMRQGWCAGVLAGISLLYSVPRSFLRAGGGGDAFPPAQ